MLISSYNDAQRFRLYRKRHRYVAGVFAVQLERRRGGRSAVNLSCPEIVYAAQPRMLTQQNRRAIAAEVGDTSFFQHADIEQTVVEFGAGKERIPAAVETTVADENSSARNLTGFDGRVFSAER